MQDKVITGRIYRGSTAQITVQAFKCNVDPSEITEWEIFFFTDNGHSLDKTEGAVLKGNMVTVVFSKEDLDIMADGVIRYQCNYAWGGYESDMICTNTNWVLKTPEYYKPSEYPSIEEVEEVVDEKIDAQQFKTINGETITGNGNIVIQGGSGSEEVQQKIDDSLTDYYNKSQVDGKIPTKTSQLENDSNFLTEHQHLKTINGETIVGYGNIVIQGGGSGSDICVCYLKEDKTRVGDFDELYKRVTDKDVAKPFICYFIDSGNTMYETYVKAHAYTSPNNRYLTIGIPVLETTCVLTSYNNVSFNTTSYISISKYTNHAVLSDNINAIKAVTQSQYEDMAIDENTIYFIKG